jgi:hypothetical protein
MARQPGWPSMARNAGLCEMSSTPKRPRDFSQAAKLVIDIATGQVEDRLPIPEEQGIGLSLGLVL